MIVQRKVMIVMTWHERGRKEERGQDVFSPFCVSNIESVGTIAARESSAAPAEHR
jgi:hypothetical protein